MCVSLTNVFTSPWSFPYASPSLFSTHPHILTSSHVSSWHADIVISVIIYLLMQTWPCPRYAVRQKYSYCSHCETNKEWDRRDINYCSTATVFHISLSSLSTPHITHTLMHACLTCVSSNGYTYEKGTLFHSVTHIWIRWIDHQGQAEIKRKDKWGKEGWRQVNGICI